MNDYRSIQQPEQIPERFKDAWNRNDPRGIADLFAEDADFINVTGKWWDNKKDIFDAHDFGLRVIFQNSNMEVLRIKKKLLSTDIAVVHAHIRITGQAPLDVDPAGIRETLFIFVARKNKEHWICVSAQNTDIIFGEQTHIRDIHGNLKAVSYKERLPKR